MIVDRLPILKVWLAQWLADYPIDRRWEFKLELLFEETALFDREVIAKRMVYLLNYWTAGVEIRIGMMLRAHRIHERLRERCRWYQQEAEQDGEDSILHMMYDHSDLQVVFDGPYWTHCHPAWLPLDDSFTFEELLLVRVNRVYMMPDNIYLWR